jgi:hypothetical protein
MDSLSKLFGKKRSLEQSAPATKTTKPLPLRLADPAHPARKQLDQVVKIVDQYVQVELVGDRTAMIGSAPVGDMKKALSNLGEAIAICPDDMDLLVAKACILHASAQFKSAEEVLDLVLSEVPDHFEAKMWKSHWETWGGALRFPRWDERLSLLHPVMAAHLRHDHRVQVVRDGMQKTPCYCDRSSGTAFRQPNASKNRVGSLPNTIWPTRSLLP